MDKFYPTAPAGGKAETALDYAVEAPAIIALLESGCPAPYAARSKDLVAGQPLPKAHICGIVLAGRNCPEGMSAVYDRVIAERDAMAAVPILKDDRQADYIAKLDAVAVVASSATWLTKLKAANGVTLWDDLKAKVAVEAVAVAEEPIEEEIKP